MTQEPLVLDGNDLPEEYIGSDTYRFGLGLHRGHTQEPYRLLHGMDGGVMKNYDPKVNVRIIGVNAKFANEVLKKMEKTIRDMGCMTHPFATCGDLVEAVKKETTRQSKRLQRQ